MSVTINRTYAPTAAELNDEIESILLKDEKANATQVRTVLLKKHQNWKLPERRVAKFVKRQKKGGDTASMDDIDDDDSTMGRVSRRMKNARRAIRATLAPNQPKKKKAASPKTTTAPKKKAVTSKRKAPKESAPPKKNKAETATSLPEPVDAEAAAKEEAAATPEPTTPGVIREGASGDDAERNLDLSKSAEEGDKHDGGACPVCEGCIIM